MGQQVELMTAETTTPAGRAVSAFHRMLDALRDHGLKVRLTNRAQAQAQCPSHHDREASLTIWDKGDRIKVKCWAGCDDELDVLAALGWEVKDLYDSSGWHGERPDGESWGYTLPDGSWWPPFEITWLGPERPDEFRIVPDVSWLETAKENERDKAAAKARAEARKTMTPVQRALDDLLQLTDFGERIALCI